MLVKARRGSSPRVCSKDVALRPPEVPFWPLECAKPQNAGSKPLNLRLSVPCSGGDRKRIHWLHRVMSSRVLPPFQHPHFYFTD